MNVNVGDKVEWNDMGSVRTGTVLLVGKKLVTIELDKPAKNWQARGIGNSQKIMADRLTVVEEAEYDFPNWEELGCN